MVMLVVQTALLVLAAFLLGYAAFYRLAGLLPAAPAFPAAVRAPRPPVTRPGSAPAIALPLPVADAVSAPGPDAYRWAAWWENGKIILGRSIPSESVRAELLSLVRRLHKGVRIEDRMKVRENEPDGWWIAASSAVRALGDLSQGRVSLDDLTMTIEGRAATGEGYERLKVTGVGLEGAAFTVLSPYLERPSVRTSPPPLPPLPKRPPSVPARTPAAPPARPPDAPVQLELGSILEPAPSEGPPPPTTYGEIAARLAALPKDASPEQRADLAGRRPPGIDGPRDGEPDDLKRIKGVGRKNEKLLNGLGVFHFDQIEGWTPEVVRWVEAYVARPGRVGREDWIGQAAALSKLGESAADDPADGLADDSADDLARPS